MYMLSHWWFEAPCGSHGHRLTLVMRVGWKGYLALSKYSPSLASFCRCNLIYAGEWVRVREGELGRGPKLRLVVTMMVLAMAVMAVAAVVAVTVAVVGRAGVPCYLDAACRPVQVSSSSHGLGLYQTQRTAHPQSCIHTHGARTCLGESAQVYGVGSGGGVGGGGGGGGGGDGGAHRCRDLQAISHRHLLRCPACCRSQEAKLFGRPPSD
jgi:hypothetical protein